MVCLLLFTFGAAAPAAAPSRTVLVFGDSLSAAYGLPVEQGWVHRLGARLARERPGWRVVNASVSGETTAGGAARFAADLAAHDPDVVVLELGANDALRGLPLDVAKRNLAAMVDAARAAGARVLVVGMRIPPNYGPDYAAQFEAMYRDVSAGGKAALLPFLLEPIAADRANFLDDNLHPTADAQAKLVEHVWPALVPLLDATAATAKSQAVR
jgi:acyl-CoA thioesterase-1